MFCLIIFIYLFFYKHDKGFVIQQKPENLETNNES